MAINIASNFDLFAALPLDARTLVADLTARDAIDAGQRYKSMIVYVESDDTYYALVGGITNADWKVFFQPGGATVQTDYYVATTGNDANPGTQASPFLTPQAGIDACIASLAVANEVNLYFDTGVYDFAGTAMDIESNVGGVINVIGDVVTPVNVIIRGPVLGSGTVFSLNDANLIVNADGCVYTRCLYGARVIAGQFKSNYNSFSEMYIPLQTESPLAHIILPQNASGDTIINGPSVSTAGTYVVRNLNGGTFELDQSLTTLNTNYGIESEGELYLNQARVLNMTLRSYAGAYGIKTSPDSFSSISSTIVLDGTSAQATLTDANIGFDLSGVIDLPFSSNFNYSNLYNAIYLRKGCRLFESSLGNTWSYITGITREVLFEENATWSTANEFDSTDLVYFGTGSNDSSNYQLQNFIRMIS